MKKSKSSGPDQIPCNIIKLVKFEIANALTLVINTSLETGNFPECYKEAKVSALWKHKGSRHDKVNFRPVSGLPFLGKVQEAIVNIYRKENENDISAVLYWLDNHQIINHI